MGRNIHSQKDTILDFKPLQEREKAVSSSFAGGGRADKIKEPLIKGA